MADNLEKQLEDFVISNKEYFYRLAYSYVKNNDDALDVVQESIYKSFSYINSLKDSSSMKTWFYRIVVNTSIDFLRKRKREIVVDEEFLLNNNVEVVENYADIDLKRAIESLPHKYKSIIVLRFYEDLKLNEIAEILDENVSTIKTRLYKALSILRIEYEE